MLGTTLRAAYRRKCGGGEGSRRVLSDFSFEGASDGNRGDADPGEGVALSISKGKYEGSR